MQPVIDLRPMTPADLEFMYRVYASTRAEEMALVNWPPPQQETFLRMQFEAQHQHYSTNYPGAQFNVVLVDGLPAGRLYLVRWPSQYRVMDIALLPEFRGLGVGSWLLNDLFERARAEGVDVSIHVEQFNPALRLYQRLGFQLEEDKGVYLLMRWRPASPTTAPSEPNDRK